MTEEYLAPPPPSHLMDAAIELGFEDKVWYVSGDVIEWKEGESVTDEELASIRARATELETAYNNKQYQRDRADAYPKLTEQLDMLWHAIDTDTLDKTSDFYTELKQVKDDNPKPSE